MKTTTGAQIIVFIRSSQQASPHEIQKALGISPQALHRQLKKLILLGQILKVGRAPRVFYKLTEAPPTSQSGSVLLSGPVQKFIEDKYLYADPQGWLLNGVEGFFAWAKNTQQFKLIDKLSNEYITVRKDADSHFEKQGFLIEATPKFKATFDKSFLDEVFYVDFYSLPKFGKTKLGALVLHSKQAQDIRLIKVVAKETQDPIDFLIKKKKIEALVWVPHSLPRKVPFLKILREQLNLSLPEIPFVKAYKGEIPIAQKSLSKLDERIENASSTIFPKNTHSDYKRILVIDDAVGSGATLEAVAKKLKHMNPRAVVFGFAVVGSIKGFEVIKEI